jgi:radical SAM superfamily enzyme YgiQ (UPF0313 family)
MEKRRVYFNEFNVLMEKAAYLPFASGLLCAYARAQEHLSYTYEFAPFLFIRQEPEMILTQYHSPAVASFSISMWNEQLSLQVAKEVKRKFPQCLIVVGGPQVPHEANEYFLKHPFIDVAVRFDGEETFSKVLERFVCSRDFKGIPNISWREARSHLCVRNDDGPLPTQDLDAYPSPYVTGLFDYLFADRKRKFDYQAIIETNRGCPFGCAYCVWSKGQASKKLRFHSMARVAQEITWCGVHKIKYLFNADSNFGIHSHDLDIAKLLVKTKARYGCPEKFRTCYTKNSDERIYSLAKLLCTHQLEKGITLSFQSLNPNVLRNVNRENINLSTYKKLLTRFNKEKIPVYTELILGLPGETLRSWKEGIEEVIQSGLRSQLFVYPCEVYPNTAIGDSAYQKKFGIFTQRIRLTEVHGAIRKGKGVAEYQDIIVKTDSMSAQDWQRAMVFSWWVLYLYSLKAGFFIMWHIFERYGLAVTSFVEYLCEDTFPKACVLLNKEAKLYRQHALKIQQGAGRCFALPEFGEIYWDVEEATFLRMAGSLDKLYAEVFIALKDYLGAKGVAYNEEELRKVVEYQRQRMPTWKKGRKKEFAREVLLWGRKNDRLLVERKSS